MPIHFRNSPVNEPFIFDSIGNRWSQDRVLRPNGYPLYHYLQTEKGRGIVELQGKTYTLDEGEGILIAPYIHHTYNYGSAVPDVFKGQTSELYAWFHPSHDIHAVHDHDVPPECQIFPD